MLSHPSLTIFPQNSQCLNAVNNLFASKKVVWAAEVCVDMEYEFEMTLFFHNAQILQDGPKKL